MYNIEEARKRKLHSVMDSVCQRDGRLMDIVDQRWREENKLPYEDIAVPEMELPDPEPDNGHSNETLQELEQKWTDLGLSSLHEQQNTGGQS
ncbi:anaphase-promoting complex subunit 13-like [Lingula anatina]|uniref:Anaphase-promoting complex subunit 13 n=1 Tax=Lingula anatina TaxID=7574 RepID=A0A2R2MRY4_LINAN|nr:anaphase-promoting complex subunit 13-like [Lingula anatina]|eukprot:XP_023933021.1 anaphase-promoting complex subunit 13-like [Lingula anatina]